MADHQVNLGLHSAVQLIWKSITQNDSAFSNKAFGEVQLPESSILTTVLNAIAEYKIKVINPLKISSGGIYRYPAATY